MQAETTSLKLLYLGEKLEKNIIDLIEDQGEPCRFYLEIEGDKVPILENLGGISPSLKENVRIVIYDEKRVYVVNTSDKKMRYYDGVKKRFGHIFREGDKIDLDRIFELKGNPKEIINLLEQNGYELVD